MNKLQQLRQQEQFEKNRLAACDAQTPEEAERETDFVDKHIKEQHRMPTYSDAIEYGIKLQKEKTDKLKQLGWKMYHAYQYLTNDSKHVREAMKEWYNFINYELNKK